MKTFKSTINNKSASFRSNKESMMELVDKLNSFLKISNIQGNEIALKRAKERGKSLTREKLTKLLDKNSPFIELMPLAGLKHENGFGPGGTTIAGIGFVHKKLCVINANIGTKKGGVVDYATSLKNLRLSQIAKENKLTTINLVESGGANLPDQDRVFNNYGSMFKEMSKRSKDGIITISIVFGNATAGGAYVPGMSDYTIMQKDQAKVFLAGPPLVKMATNEDSNDEELGGALMHNNLSGVSDFIADDEDEAIKIAREIVDTNIIDKSVENLKENNPPIYDKEEILGIIPSNLKTPFDIRDLIVRFVDDSKFTEFKSSYGLTMKCGWAKINDRKIGIIASNGVIFSESAKKATQFIQLANKSNIPLLFIHNTTGFMVGKRHEQKGIINHGAQLIHAVAGSEVPHLTLFVGNSYGAGNYAMCGRSFEPRFLFSYPNVKSGVMGAEQLAGVMEIIKVNSAKRLNKKIDKRKLNREKKNLILQAEEKASVWHTTSEVMDDGIIDPRDTRSHLKLCLEIIYKERIIGSKSFGTFRM
jgi:acetyl-CoA carboxylase carboxyltransferase component